MIRERYVVVGRVTRWERGDGSGDPFARRATTTPRPGVGTGHGVGGGRKTHPRVPPRHPPATRVVRSRIVRARSVSQ
jgi:hypothetical protein